MILACAATNQAVTNIISSMNSESEDLLSSRWLPEVRSYGTFCCSERRSEEFKEFHQEFSSGEGFLKSIENREYLKKSGVVFFRKIFSSLKQKCKFEKCS